MTIKLPQEPQRILIIKPSSLGDVVHALPVLVLLRKRFPNAHIAWLVAPYCAGLVAGLPQLNEVILFERRRFGRIWRNLSATRELIQFLRGLRDRQFDLVIDLQGLLRSGVLARQTGAPMRVGLATAREGAPLFYTHRVPADIEQHAVDRYLLVAHALGCPKESPVFPFPVGESDRCDVADAVGDGDYAVLLPATNWPSKRWPADRFASLVEPLQRLFGLKSIFAGGSDVAELAPQVNSVVNLAGKTTLPQLVALLERAKVVIANDSGPMHIAAALQRPLVAVFGPTNPFRTGPYGRSECVVRLDLPCSPCYSRTCSHQSCLNWLEMAPVLDLADRQLQMAVT